jgi:uncharacterized membrane protein
MPIKYDTNPLDPDFPEKAKAMAAAADDDYETQTLPYKGGDTRQFAPDETAEQTRKFVANDVSAYSQSYSQTYSPPYNGQYVPAPYQSYAMSGSPAGRKIESLGIPENVLTTLAYVPFWIGFVAAVVELLIVPRSEPKVRFHAAQGLAVHIAILLIGILLGGIGNFVPFAGIASTVFWAASTGMLIVFAIKAWQGKPIHIESVDTLTNWLEQKISLKQ